MCVLINGYRGSDEQDKWGCWHLLITPIIPPNAMTPNIAGPRLAALVLMWCSQPPQERVFFLNSVSC